MAAGLGHVEQRLRLDRISADPIRHSITNSLSVLSAGTLDFFVDRFSRADCRNYRSGLIGTINNSVAAYSETPITFQFSCKWLSAGGIFQDVIEGSPHFSFHFGMQMTDKLPDCLRNLEGSIRHPEIYSSKSASTV